MPLDNLFNLKFDSQIAFSILHNQDEGFVSYCHQEGTNFAQLNKQGKERSLVNYLLQLTFKNFNLPYTNYVHGDGGQPIFPKGTCGTVTHCQDYAAVLVSRDDHVRLVGIDLEHFHQRNFSGLAQRVLTSREIQNLPKDLNERDREIIALFSAKETLYKAYYPFVQEWFGFQEAECVAKEKNLFYFNFMGSRKSLANFKMPISVNYLWQDDFVLTYLLAME